MSRIIKQNLLGHIMAATLCIGFIFSLCTPASAGVCQNVPAITQAVDAYAANEQFTMIPTVQHTTVIQNYALVDWIAGEGAGEVLLQLTGSTWTVLSFGGGSINQAVALESLGVPVSVAGSLAAQMHACEGTRTPL